MPTYKKASPFKQNLLIEGGAFLIAAKPHYDREIVTGLPNSKPGPFVHVTDFQKVWRRNYGEHIQTTGWRGSYKHKTPLETGAAIPQMRTTISKSPPKVEIFGFWPSCHVF